MHSCSFLARRKLWKKSTGICCHHYLCLLYILTYDMSAAGFQFSCEYGDHAIHNKCLCCWIQCLIFFFLLVTLHSLSVLSFCFMTFTNLLLLLMYLFLFLSLLLHLLFTCASKNGSPYHIHYTSYCMLDIFFIGVPNQSICIFLYVFFWTESVCFDFILSFFGFSCNFLFKASQFKMSFRFFGTGVCDL